ncbi:sigma-70 family RNA polymerase sigma factor [Lacibacter luteus]|uniref:Sigma-70 family RNA polymerase sigma factor n=1 Tax=Lacibacter luteus TaxID=2508719 RepID=A0A4Q1CEF3_9BACT|nr:sigma-70 family RNA polymerase sigma factor [Lacibacter luteus]RXK57852.1 sigma-70 family RNA polymerase sigma factor [Lacibacter luteus]
MDSNGFHNKDEQELWRSFVSGNDQSLETLYRRYFDELYNYGNKWLNNPSLTQDSIQDLFVKLMRNRSNLTIPDSVKYYLLRSFRSIVLDKLKVNDRMKLMDEPKEHMFQVELCPEEQMIGQEEDKRLQKQLTEAIQQLTPRQREAVFLKYQEGLSYPEIAEMLALSQKATYKLVARAIQTLRTITDSATLIIAFFLYT